VWSRVVAGTQSQRGNAVAVDKNGNAFVAGSLSGMTSFGVGATTSVDLLDGFLMKLGPNGTPSWLKTFGGIGDDEATAVTALPGGEALVTGYFDETVNFGSGNIDNGGGDDVFLAKVSSAGNIVFGKTFPANGDQLPDSISVDSAGNIVLCGSFFTEE